MGDILFYVVVIAALALPDLLSPYLKALYTWQDLKYRDDVEKRFDRLLAKAGLAPYTRKRRNAAGPALRTRDAEVWNRPVDAVDRSDGLESVVRGKSEETNFG